MNIGQVLETHLGWAAKQLGFRGLTPVFDGANEIEIEAELARSWLVEAWRILPKKPGNGCASRSTILRRSRTMMKCACSIWNSGWAKRL
jgi:hypothetical protein